MTSSYWPTIIYCIYAVVITVIYFTALWRVNKRVKFWKEQYEFTLEQFDVVAKSFWEMRKMYQEAMGIKDTDIEQTQKILDEEHKKMN